MSNTQGLNPTWDLDSIFPGGSQSAAFQTFLEDLQTRIGELDAAAAGLTAAASQSDWVKFWISAQDVEARLHQAAAYVECLTAQDMKDEGAKLLEGRVTQLGAAYDAVITRVDGILLDIPDAEWKALVASEKLRPVAFTLEEKRRLAADKMDTEKEVLVSDLGVDGYRAWGDLYYAIVSRMTLPFEEDGEVKQLSMGQASNKMLTPDRAVREKIFREWENVWGAHADLFAHTLNHLSGYRLSVYRHRGWTSVLKEPLSYNRMSQATLEAMWGVIERNLAPFVDYLNRKAKLLGIDKLSWHDVSAPLPGPDRIYTYEQAHAFIVEQFGKFSPRMAEFADMCFKNRWIEAEDRPGKRPGAFCTGFPVSKQSRVFATFSGTADNVNTLAHEIGHAFHSSVLRELPLYAQHYAMNVAETASTFAETIVMDASVKGAATDEERIALLDQKVEQSIAMFMNIRARFLFETRFYAKRQQGLLSVEEINTLMEEAQREAYGGALAEYHPHFWASKLHFYITDVPFYNFPYTFGYMFSTGIYARALEEGAGFADRYVALLQDTGRMSTEDLAQKHLGVDLTKPDFWQQAMDVAIADVLAFLQLTA
ncbi:M3 family oligoendopeptidase [Alicyclobacillus cycloheptanicus]|uniref:PepF/M3 family oligoendopeptidase n=1 Tax=Alicyclobacillus cycloheptanicus TaxID=1457 RepID=A0ABT9XJX2_9BACL|nr:M3 family oligoendopeptidase [Alicyclobacillus cycloheptanicus]MDQ0190021.1 pepF/M3 family oligoendopeptidase [Alicyclobacillus cycloheptanicus]WDM00077.1 M3 family oligoendopeptidase [Alicyclobacillus cycloheptanicus]